MKKRDLLNSLLGIALLCFTSLWTTTATAQGVIADESNDRWRSTLYLYLWATSLDGTLLFAVMKLWWMRTSVIWPTIWQGHSLLVSNPVKVNGVIS